MSQAFKIDEPSVDELQSLRQRLKDLEHEVADYQRKHEAAAASEEIYRSVCDHQSEIICRVDADLKLTFVNRTFGEYFGRSEDDLLGADYVQFFAPSLQERAREKFCSLFQSPQVISHVCEIIRKGGHSGWQHCVVTPVLDSSGAVAELQVVARVRSARQQAEYEIEHADLVQGQLANIMNDGLIIVDAKGVITALNKKGCEIAGMNAEDMIGRTMLEAAGSHNQDMLSSNFARRSRGDTSPFELTWENGKARQITAIFTPTPLYDENGKFDGSLSVVKNITHRREVELQLRENERLLAASQRIARIGTFEWKIGDETLTWSRELYNVMGIAPDECSPTKETFISCVHPDHREEVLEQIDRVFSGNATNLHEYRIVRPANGEVRWVKSIRWLQTDANGTPVGMIGATQDITEHKRADLELEESESILRSYYESGLMLMGVVELDGEDVRFVSENAKTAKMLGTTPELMRGRSLGELGVTKEAIAVWVSRFREAERTGEMVRFEYARPHDALERWWAASVKMIGQTPDGISRFSYVADDVTDRKHAEAKAQADHQRLEERVLERTLELQKANDQLRFHAKLLDSVRESVVATDVQGRIVYWGKGAEKLYGYHAKEVSNQPMVQVTRPDGARGDELRMAQVCEKGSWQGELLLCRKQGLEFWGETVISLVTGPDHQPSGFIAIDRDITVRRQAEEKVRQFQSDLAHVQRLGTMGEMASGLAHEINQPFGSIANNANAVLRGLKHGGLPKQELLEVLEEISAEAMRGGDILHSLRRFTSKARPKRSIVELRDLIQEVARLFEPDSRRHAITLSLDLDADLQPVSVEPIQIQQVVVNLVRNAFDALVEEGRQPRKVTIQAKPDPHGVLIKVIDNGKKLSEDIGDKIFRPYFTTKEDGMGMGLSICRSIVNSHGGRLWATGNPDLGMTFSFRLPHTPRSTELQSERNSRY